MSRSKVGQELEPESAVILLGQIANTRRALRHDVSDLLGDAVPRLDKTLGESRRVAGRPQRAEVAAGERRPRGGVRYGNSSAPAGICTQAAASARAFCARLACFLDITSKPRMSA